MLLAIESFWYSHGEVLKNWYFPVISIHFIYRNNMIHASLLVQILLLLGLDLIIICCEEEANWDGHGVMRQIEKIE